MKSEFLVFDPIPTPLGEISLCAYFKKNSGEMARPWRRLTGYALVLILRGKGIFQKPGKEEQPLYPGSALWIVPGEDHYYRPEGEWDEFFILFEGALFDLAKQQGVFPATSSVTGLRGIESWQETFSDLFLHAPRKLKSDQMSVMSRFFERLLALSAHFQEKRFIDETFIEKSQKWMNPWGGVSLEPQTCAQRLGMSYSHFRHRFREETGESPEKFRSRQRLIKACALLRGQNKNLKEIAQQLGYYDEFHFSKQFKAHLHYSPSVYRKMHRDPE